MEELIEILSDLHPEVDFETENGLVDKGILDSFDIVSIVTEVTDVFDVTIDASELIPANFNSAKALYKLICKKMDDED